MSASLKDKILDSKNYTPVKQDYYIADILDGNKRIVASYSAKRAAKDARGREKAIEKLITKLNRSSRVKTHLSVHGYKVPKSGGKIKSQLR